MDTSAGTAMLQLSLSVMGLSADNASRQPVDSSNSQGNAPTDNQRARVVVAPTAFVIISSRQFI
jgi:hypothetical protein